MSEETFKIVPLELLVSARFQSHFPLDQNDVRFKELVESIKTVGIKQPLLVRALDDGKLEIVAGERRFRAAKLAELILAPVIIEKLDDLQAAIGQGVENLQRQDLNEAEKSRYLAFLAVEFHLSAKEIAEKLGMSYPWVVRYLPAEFKNGEKAGAGKLGGLAKGRSYGEESAIPNIAPEELAESEKKARQHRTQCQDPRCLHFVPDDEIRYRNGMPYCLKCAPFIKEASVKKPEPKKPVSPKSFDRWGQKDANMHPEKSGFEERVVNRFNQWLSENGLHGLRNEEFCVLSTKPDDYVPEIKGLVYVDGPPHLKPKQADKDERLRDLLVKHNPELKTKGFAFKADTQKEEDRVFGEMQKWVEGLKEQLSSRENVTLPGASDDKEVS